MDIANLPVDTCPLCRERGLAWSGTTCACRVCGSVFEVNPVTRRCRYTHVAESYATAEPALISDWLTRHEVFDRVEAALPARSTRANTAAPAPLMVVWAILVGALLLIPFLCACLSALLIGPGIAQTRQLIAAANLPTASLVRTGTSSGDATGHAFPVYPLDSPVELPTSTEQTVTPEPPQVTETSIEVSPAFPLTITVEIINQTTEPTPLPAETVQHAPTMPPSQATATVPATFTPAPTTAVHTAVPTNSPLPSLVITPSTTAQLTSTVTPTVSVTPTTTLIVTPTVTVTPTLVVATGCTGTVVISTVMYTGTASLNQSDQYVEILNRASQPVNVTNWTVRALSSGRGYVFPNGLNLQPGQTCRVYTNYAQDYGNCGALRFGSPSPVWSNVSDTAELRDNIGAVICLYHYQRTTQ